MSKLTHESSMRLEKVEERVYSDVISAIRALPVPETRKKPLVDAAMQILCDTEEELVSAPGDDAKLAKIETAAWLRVASLEEEIASIRGAV